MAEPEELSSAKPSQVGMTENHKASVIPFMVRSASEIPRPKDWQAFERLSLVLFKAHLKDSEAQLYGRSGQDQGGADVEACREGDPARRVVVQCRRVETSLTEAEMMADCERAIERFKDPKEIFFATGAPNDTKAVDAARNVERQLQEKGLSIRVINYGWESLQNLIAEYPEVHAQWQPAMSADAGLAQLSGQIASMQDTLSQVLANTQPALISDTSKGDGGSDENSEDPVLHAKIDAYREDLVDGQTASGQRKLEALLKTFDHTAKPWAYYRVLANLGKAALDLGHHEEAARLYEEGFDLRPDDPSSIANLALARLIQGRYDEAIELAQKALGMTPSPVQAVGYLLQAAARSSWSGDPETLVPAEHRETEEAAIGLAEFFRLRSVDGWQRKAMSLAVPFPDSRILRRVSAFAVLTLVADNPDFLPGGRTDVTTEEIKLAATHLAESSERFLQLGYGDKEELKAVVHNAAILLRIAERLPEAEALLRKGLSKLGKDNLMSRLLAVVLALQGKQDESLSVIDQAADDPECQLMAVEMIAAKDPRSAFQRLQSMSVTTFEGRPQEMYFNFLAELALEVGEFAVFDSALSEMRAMKANPILIRLLEALHTKVAGGSVEEVATQLTEIAASVTDNELFGNRFLVAEQLHDNGLALDASRLLEGYVDLKRVNGGARFYLQCLADGRRDQKFYEVLDQGKAVFSKDPGIAFIEAEHAYNTGDLERAVVAADRLIDLAPASFKARMLTVEILVRKNDVASLRQILSEPIEDNANASLQAQLRLIALLAYFGERRRSAALAYRVYLANADVSEAWTALMGAILEANTPEDQRVAEWGMTKTGDDAAVDITFHDGQKRFFVIEPSAVLRKLDREALEPQHELAKAVFGKQAGETFTFANGRTGVVNQVRHKYVARMQYVMMNHESRFPDTRAIQAFHFEPEVPGGMDEVLEELRAVHEHGISEFEAYDKGTYPLRVLAYRLRRDMIDTAGAVANAGFKLKVDTGIFKDRKKAADLVSSSGAGCVIDLGAYCIAWRLKALPAIVSTMGPLSVTPSTIDRLRARLDRLSSHGEDGILTMGYANGGLSVSGADAEVVEVWKSECRDSIQWLRDNATIVPARAPDTMPDVLLRSLKEKPSDIYDDLLVAHELGVPLISDDGPYRVMAEGLGVQSVWLQQVLASAVSRGHATEDDFIYWTAALIDAGQSHLSVNHPALVMALRRDKDGGNDGIGWTFKALANAIGGEQADPDSHLVVVVNFLMRLWSWTEFDGLREQATSHIMRRLLSGRYNDYRSMFHTVRVAMSGFAFASKYLADWAVGHFIIMSDD